MLDQLLNYISEQKLFRPEQQVLLAVSGGIDSMAMAYLFRKAKFNFAIAHCNFQLRGKASDEDQLLVEEMANTYLRPFYLKSFETEEYAKKHGISIQMSARYLRRAWFDELMKNERFDVIATAHHLNDSLETVLFNLVKGTGISGLKGILPKNEKYIRPLMFATRDMIFDFVQANNITWREDSSNSSIKYHRNLIRHKVVPELKKINPKLEDTFSQSLEKISSAERIYKSAVNQQKEKLIEKTGEGVRIEKDRLKSIEEAGIILFEILEEYGFNYHQVKDILLVLDRQPGKSFYSHEWHLVIDRQFLYISKIKKDKLSEAFIEHNTKCIEVFKNKLTFEKADPEKVEFSENKNIVFLDFEKLEFPLTIRKWKHGDRFQPLGMKHKKKLSDFMIDEKIPLNLKEQVLALISGENIVWVIGHRIDDRYKITNQTRIAYKISNSYDNDKSI
ncbi:MAG: tRNA lysidine(34) synthetase TilS [Cyclobacteriaceae bacterium]|nr:tRNA lysidine(34) synthetase TilS [Cyclobacteriaceae bacterium]